MIKRNYEIKLQTNTELISRITEICNTLSFYLLAILYWEAYN